ncbi:putative DD41D transposase [Trichonephila clavipes]|nr:putative DD41D transposase [Trichonephila clavipes]
MDSPNPPLPSHVDLAHVMGPNHACSCYLPKFLRLHTSQRRHLREFINRKRPQFWQYDFWYLLHDNAPANRSQLFGLAIHQNDHQPRRIFVEWAQNEIAVVPDFHKRILFSDEAHFWLNGYVNKQNCRIWSEANPQVYVETPLHPEN